MYHEFTNLWIIVIIYLCLDIWYFLMAILIIGLLNINKKL